MTLTQCVAHPNLATRHTTMCLDYKFKLCSLFSIIYSTVWKNFRVIALVVYPVGVTTKLIMNNFYNIIVHKSVKLARNFVNT